MKRKTSFKKVTNRAEPLWLWGTHAVLAALKNPKRKISRLVLSQNSYRQYGEEIESFGRNDLEIEESHPKDIDKLLPPEAVHQGMALLTTALPFPDLPDACGYKAGQAPVIVLLDQITDPHNIGALMRSAVALGAQAIVTTSRHSAPESGVMAKTACGALEIIPYVRITNLSRAMDELKEMGYTLLGLDGHTDTFIRGTDSHKYPTGIILGAEGKGLRAKTREHCDALVRLPMSNLVESYNVSNAGALALYELTRNRWHKETF